MRVIWEMVFLSIMKLTIFFKRNKINNINQHLSIVYEKNILRNENIIIVISIFFLIVFIFSIFTTAKFISEYF